MFWWFIGLSTLDHEKSFVEFPAIILSTRKCQRDIQAASKTNLDLTRQVSISIGLPKLLPYCFLLFTYFMAIYIVIHSCVFK